MCGIAGFCLSPTERKLNSNKLAKRLLLGIEHRGRDATGAVWRDNDGSFVVQKASLTASKFVPALSVPRKAQAALLHTRAWTVGTPDNNDNNHPIVTGGLAGVHNGGIWNDDDIFEDLGIKDRRIGQVDSEAIFAALAYGFEDDGTGNKRVPAATHWTDVLEIIEGTAAIAWMDTHNDPGVIYCARLYSSPLVWGQTKAGSFIFASTRFALETACKSVNLDLVHVEEMKEGEFFTVVDGRITEVKPFVSAAEFSPYRYHRSSVSRSRYSTALDNVTDFDSYEYVSTSDGGYTAVKKTQPRRYLDTDYMELGTDFEALTPEGYHRRYEKREEAIDKWMSALKASDTEVLQTCLDTQAWVRPGQWVTTEVMGAKVYAQLMLLPQEFPGGKYHLRAIIPNSERTAKFEVVYLTRTFAEFEVVESWTASFNRPKGLMASA